MKIFTCHHCNRESAGTRTNGWLYLPPPGWTAIGSSVVCDRKECDDAERTEIAARRTAVIDHAYLSAGDTSAANGDRPYTGCFLCGRSRREHAL